MPCCLGGASCCNERDTGTNGIAGDGDIVHMDNHSRLLWGRPTSDDGRSVGFVRLHHLQLVTVTDSTVTFSHSLLSAAVLTSSCFFMACSHRRHGQDKTVLSCLQLCSHRRRWQDKTVLSCPHRQCEHNCKQDKTVLSGLCWRCEPDISCKLETGSRRDKTHRNWVAAVNKPLQLLILFFSQIFCSATICHFLFHVVAPDSVKTCTHCKTVSSAYTYVTLHLTFQLCLLLLF